MYRNWISGLNYVGWILLSSNITSVYIDLHMHIQVNVLMLWGNLVVKVLAHHA